MAKLNIYIYNNFFKIHFLGILIIIILNTYLKVTPVYAESAIYITPGMKMSIYNILVSSTNVEQFVTEIVSTLNFNAYPKIKTRDIIMQALKLIIANLEKEDPIDHDVLEKAKAYLKYLNSYSWSTIIVTTILFSILLLLAIINPPEMP